MTALKDCRVCGQPVAARAKTCPGCGVKKPTASKTEAGLDATGAAIVKLGLLLIMLAVVVVACTTDAAAPPRTTDPAATAPTTNQSATPTTTVRRVTTTTTRRTTTTAPAATDEECNAQATAFMILLPEVIGWFDTLALQAEIGAVVGVQETYGLLKWAMADLPRMSRELLDDCGHHLTESDLRDARAGLDQAEAGWRAIQAVCRSDLAALGFDC